MSFSPHCAPIHHSYDFIYATRQLMSRQDGGSFCYLEPTGRSVIFSVRCLTPSRLVPPWTMVPPQIMVSPWITVQPLTVVPSYQRLCDHSLDTDLIIGNLWFSRKINDKLFSFCLSELLKLITTRGLSSS